MSVTCVGCHWLLIYTWFGRLSNIAYRYRNSISNIKTYSIGNIDFLTPSTVINSQTMYPIWQMSILSCWEWLQRRVSDNRYDHDPMHFWAVMGYKNCCEAFIQMLLVLFPIAMNRSSGYNPICCPAISAKLRCFEIPCQVEKVARPACARILDVTIPWFDLLNS